jgi:hypothetical protein
MNKILLLLTTIPQTISFTPSPSSSSIRHHSHHHAVLEGREIEGALAPTNNFILVKKAGVVEQTEGGILLTGSVSIMCV